ncbi:amidohydrolase family protein [Sphingomonas sp. SRS2]|uniref:amidohydrolase family protein n=1 Tax=Sphingomonas sp. SRS2 TaxID=133190 RepID=UPI000695EB26|nr:amidohydrolase family protein [Sphingomonas sp. SRS2]
MSLDVSPDGKTILFDMLGDIFAIPANGGEARPIQVGPAIQRTPVFSPDGRSIAFISDLNGSDNIWTSRVDGSAPVMLTQERVDMLSAPAWTSDGQAIAAARLPADAPHNYTTEIRLFDTAAPTPQGGGKTLIGAPAARRDVQEATFSPDGRYVYYTERLKRDNIYIDATFINFGVKRRDLGLGVTELMASGWGGAIAPALSRDGKQLAFVRRVRAKTVLFRLDLTTREQVAVYDGLDRDLEGDYVTQGNYYPRYAWFPDNVHVAIWAKGKIWKVNIFTGTAVHIPFHVSANHRVTERLAFTHDIAPDSVTVKAVRQAVASPDGRTILVTALGHIWRKEWNDAAPFRLTKESAFEFEPAWSGDGKRIVFATWDDELGGAIVVTDAQGRGARTIVKSAGAIRQPQFSPDGRDIVYRIQKPDPSLGGAREKPGIYTIAAKGSAPFFVASGDDYPMFSPDGERIYFVEQDNAGDNIQQVLRSIRRDGLDPRKHVVSRDADTVELRPSPDLRWIAFKDRQKYNVVRFHDMGNMVDLYAANPEVKATRLADQGGYGLSWSADSKAVTWALGATIHRVEPDAADVRAATRTVALGLTVAADKPRGAVAWVNARIIPMVGDQVIERGTIVIRDNRIEAVGPADTVKLPADAKVIDASAKTIMPGLVDAHGHIDCCYNVGIVPQKQPQRYAALAYGVTTNFDPYPNDLVSYESGETTQAGISVGPRWITTGAAIYGRSRKGDFIYMPVDSMADARDILARKKALGTFTIKNYKQPARFQRQMLMQASREAGINVASEGESHYAYDLSMILDGTTSLEHNLPVANYYDDLVQFMGKAGAHNTPVLVVSFGELFGENYMYQHTEAWKDVRIRTYVQQVLSGYSPLGTPYEAPPYSRAMTTINLADELWDIGFRSVSRATKKLDDAGVVINVGSHGEIPGLAMHWEMNLLAQGGMAPIRILRAATINPANTLGIDAQIGSLVPGKLADLIVLDKNPLDDIRNSESVVQTVVNGRIYDTATMNEAGNYSRPRGKFYWELRQMNGINWNPAWTGGE